MNNCSDFVVQMHMYIDGELEDCALLFKHLEQCESCKALFADYSALASAARALPTDVPDNLHSNIMRAVSREKAKQRNRKIARIALPFAACAVIAAAVFLPQSLKNAEFSGAGANTSRADIKGFALPQATSAATAEPPLQAPAGEQKSEAENETKFTHGTDKFDSNAAPPSFPMLTRSLAYAEYILAYGGADLPDFGLGETWTGNTDLHDGMTFWAIENTPDARESALDFLAVAGFTVIFEAEGAPEGDPYAGKILIVILQ